MTPNPTTTSSAPAADSDSEDDYMKMDFSNPPPTNKQPPESSIARLRRLRREAELRSRPKSKAELEAEASSRLETAHSQSLLSQNPKSKGLAMMAKMGFTPGKTLGKQSSETTTITTAVKEPIKISIKDGREGIGLESEKKRKMKEVMGAHEKNAKRAKVDEGEYRDRMRREREEARLGRLLGAAQKVAEGMGNERLGGGSEGKALLLLKGIPVVWRGLVKSREEGERMRKMRHDLEYGLAARLPTYDDADEDEDDKKALGKNATTYVASEDLDEEDEELEEFEQLPVEERLSKVVGYLRDEFNYCFWCKYAYPDEKMEGCPGLTEEDHD
ncbi:hypothetical protein QBC38DRAFT_478213 [Podospora fimiseda]|uniref:G-patch domain-containing protein n=1 Tax=Podospora fimiseda TaxID=252190 RepID=A0AAN7BQD4_9PEZI|nr:hypothetical protein QBC38DRAFT_478213 [Podospora fimiseda]